MDAIVTDGQDRQRSLYVWAAQAERLDVRGVTDDHHVAQVRMLDALTNAYGHDARGTIQRVCLDSHAQVPRYIYGRVLLRVHRSHDGRLRWGHQEDTPPSRCSGRQASQAPAVAPSSLPESTLRTGDLR